MDERAFREVYAACSGTVFTYARRRFGGSDAEDVLAEVFLVAWRRRDHLPSEPLPWLLGIARRVSANRARSQARAVAVRERLEHEVGVAAQAPESVDSRERVLNAMAEISVKDRDLLELLAWEGLSRAQLAAVFEVSEATIAVRIYRARRRLAVALAEQTQASPMQSDAKEAGHA